MKSTLHKITEHVEKINEQFFSDFDENNTYLRPRDDLLDIAHIIEKCFIVIAEVKKSSPSAGIICQDFKPIDLALSYENAGAHAVSVVTDKKFFGGCKQHLRMVKEKVRIPVLRKDFLIHPAQIYESYNLGADIVLLISACLRFDRLQSLYNTTRMLDMNAIVEVHTEEDIEKALRLEPEIIGINNRNLHSFEVDLENSYRLKKMIPPDIHVISESGIRSHREISTLIEAGFSGVLIGEALLKEKDVEAAFRRLSNG